MFIYIHYNTFYASLVGRAPINWRNWNDDTETETDATLSESDNITDTNTDTDGQVTAHNSTDNNEPTIESEPETMVIELSCGNEAGWRNWNDNIVTLGENI
jgi:hypothetical protein